MRSAAGGECAKNATSSDAEIADGNGRISNAGGPRGRPGEAPLRSTGPGAAAMLARFVTAPEIALVVLSAFLHAIWSASIKGSRSPIGFNLLQIAPPVAAACVLPLWVPLADVPRASGGSRSGPASRTASTSTGWRARSRAASSRSSTRSRARRRPSCRSFAVPLLGESISAARRSRHRGRGRRHVGGAGRLGRRRLAALSRARREVRVAHAARVDRLLALRQGGDGAHERRAVAFARSRPPSSTT